MGKNLKNYYKIGATNPYNRAGTWTKRRLDRVQRNGRAVVKWSSRNSLFIPMCRSQLRRGSLKNYYIETSWAHISPSGPYIRPVGAIGRRAWFRPMFLKVQLLYWTLIFDFFLKLVYNIYKKREIQPVGVRLHRRSLVLIWSFIWGHMNENVANSEKA